MPSSAFPPTAAALALGLLLYGAQSAAAQGTQQAPPLAPPKPYQKVAVKMPPAINDPSLDAFRKKLAEIAAKKDRAALEPLIVSKGFFWERENGNGADEKKSGIDNFAAAAGLDAKDGSGWDFLADYAAETSASPVGDRKDFVCSPASPDFNEEEFSALLKSTETGPGEWGYPLKTGAEARESAAADAKVVEKLGMHFVRVMLEHAPPENNDTKLRIVTPAGKIAFVSAEALSPLNIDQLCYIKQPDGWRIAGYVGQGDTP